MIMYESMYAEVQIFNKEVLEEAESLKERFDALIEKIQFTHDINPNKSILKSDLKEYLDCIPEKFDLEKLKQLLTEDYETCRKGKEMSAKKIEIVKK